MEGWGTVILFSYLFVTWFVYKCMCVCVLIYMILYIKFFTLFFLESSNVHSSYSLTETSFFLPYGMLAFHLCVHQLLAFFHDFQ